MKTSNPLSKLHYNSPVILTYSIICTVLLILNYITAGWLNSAFLISYGDASLLNPLTYLRAFLHVVGHADWNHLFSNLILLLLVGPAVEERYGSGNLVIMILCNAVITAIINGLLFSSGIIGASGVVFMMIILSAFTNMQRGKIPITLILVSIMYLGREIFNALADSADGISQMAHIVGGLVGLGFGIYYYKRKFSGNY